MAKALGAKFRERIEVANSLQKLIVEEYDSFETKGGFPECCKGSLNEEDTRFKAEVSWFYISRAMYDVDFHCFWMHYAGLCIP